MLGDVDPGEGGYSNVYVTIGHALLTRRTLLGQEGSRITIHESRFKPFRLMGPRFAAEQRNAVAPDDRNEWRVKTPPGGVYGGLPVAAAVTFRSGN